MKKLFVLPLSFVVVVLAGCFEGCNTDRAVKMDSPRSVELVAKTIADNIDPGRFKVTEAYWSEGEELSNTAGNLLVDMVGADGMAWRQFFMIGSEGSSVGEPEIAGESDYDFATIHSLAPGDLDAKKIVGWIEQGKSFLPTEMQFEAVNDFNLDINPVTGEKTAFFTVCATKKGEKPAREGEITVTTYYEFPCDVLADGSVVSIETE